MPAIQLSRLRSQSAQLAARFSQPGPFVSTLHTLLDMYAERTQRPGLGGTPPGLQSYKAPKPVIRQVLSDITLLATAEPEQTFALCDNLWNEPYVEFKFLAAHLLGLASPATPLPVFERAIAWAGQTSDMAITQAIIHNGLDKVRQVFLEEYLLQVENWLHSPDHLRQQFGLLCLVPVARDQTFEDLPRYWRLLMPSIHNSPTRLYPDILDAVQAAARHWPIETAFFLREGLTLGGTPGAAWLIRKCMSIFPAETQASLRAGISKISR